MSQLITRSEAEFVCRCALATQSTVPDVWSIIWTWIGRYRQRQALGELAALNDRLLEDIGLSQKQALREAAKPFWRR